MNSLSSLDVESELSYAYIHAVAAHAGMECCITGRHSDNRGIDARITGWNLPTGTYKKEVTLNIQLKATIAEPVEDNDGRLSYFLNGIHRYNDLRDDYQIPRILVVLFLPPEKELWLNTSEEQLILKRCAYWASLLGAPDSENKSGQTVFLKKSQLFDPGGLEQLLIKIAQGQTPKY
jgi:hypothetical protein